MSHHLEIVKSFDHFLRRYCAAANLKSEPLVNGKSVGESSRAANAIAETKKNQAGRPQVAQWLRDMQNTAYKMRRGPSLVRRMREHWANMRRLPRRYEDWT